MHLFLTCGQIIVGIGVQRFDNQRKSSLKQKRKIDQIRAEAHSSTPPRCFTDNGRCEWLEV